LCLGIVGLTSHNRARISHFLRHDDSGKVFSSENLSIFSYPR
jgi:hypothetical protein